MWGEALGLLEQADRLHRQFFGLAPGAQACWQPPADIVETEHQVVVIVALPGVEPENIRLSNGSDGTLVIQADRMSCVGTQTVAVRCLEIPYGRFERRIALPSGRYELVERSSRNGCLELRLQKL
jgi:HSP20 family molecular chaperone IbpA